MNKHYYFGSPQYPPSQVFTPQGKVWSWGQPVDVAIVGQSPSTARPLARQYEVFGSKSWVLVRQLLKQWVEERGLSVLLCNAIRQPLEPRTKIPKKLTDFWTPILMEELSFFEPRTILTVGAQASRMVLGNQFKNLTEDHGAVFTIERPKAFVVPTGHFATTYNDLVQRRVLTRDLERVEAVIIGQTLEAPTYVLHQNVLPDEWMMRLRKETQVVVDIESTGLNPREDTITAVGLRFSGLNHLVFNPDHDWLCRLNRVIESNRIGIIGHNLYFDLHFLATAVGPGWARVNVRGDTMLMALVAGEYGLSLKHLTAMHTDLNSSHAFGGTDDPRYLAMDLLATESLYNVFSHTKELYVTQLLHEMLPVLVEARLNGVYIDSSNLRTIGAQLEAQLHGLRAQLQALSFPDLNPSSDQQVSAWLLDHGCSPEATTPSGRMSVSADSLMKMLEQTLTEEVRSFVSLVIEYRALRKVASGFVDNYTRLMDESSFLHPRLLLHGARTGRLSSSDPNIQQVPRSGPVKTLFISRWPGGQIGLIDLSQAELRCAALLSGDQDLRNSLLEADPHRHNASRLYGKPPDQVTAVERKKSKAITFGVLYGGSPEGLASRTSFHVNEVREAQSLFSKAFPVLMDWLKKVETDGMRKLSITTLLGRTRELESVLASEGERGARRKCANTHIQSLASDINLMIARLVSRQLRDRGLKSLFMFLVHDSILLDVHPDEIEAVAEVVREAYKEFASDSPLESLELWGRLPIIGELIIGPSWAAVEGTNESYGPLVTFPCSSEMIELKDEIHVLH